MSPSRLLVVHWNQPDACVATVRALVEQNVPLEVTVIDNDSESREFAQLRKQLAASVEIVRLEQNLGWGGALNVVLQRWLAVETSPFCLISAHDAEPSPDCLRLLIETASAHPRIGIICPQYPEPFVAKLSGRRGVAPEPVTPRPPGSLQMVDVPHGTLMLVRRECLQEIGLFDERYFAYGDEHELGARARRHGWGVAMVWGAVVTNPGTRTASALRSYLFARNSLLIVHDYRGRRSAWWRVVLLMGNTVRLFLVSPVREIFSTRARWRGVRDYLIGRFGKPTAP